MKKKVENTKDRELIKRAEKLADKWRMKNKRELGYPMTYHKELSGVRGDYHDVPHLYISSRPLRSSVLKIEIKFNWHDQGWGNMKGCLTLKLKRGEEVVEEIGQICGIAKHEAEDVHIVYHTDVPIVSSACPGDVYELWRYVGGGGGHTLTVKGMEFTILEVPQEYCEAINAFYICWCKSVSENEVQTTDQPSSFLGKLPVELLMKCVSFLSAFDFLPIYDDTPTPPPQEEDLDDEMQTLDPIDLFSEPIEQTNTQEQPRKRYRSFRKYHINK